METKKIESAADKYAESATPSNCYGDFDQNAIAEAFECGAQWRINAAWHELDEFPEPDVTVIVEYIIDGHADYVFTHLSKNINVVTDEYGFCFYVDGGKITRWAYIDDLLPDGKEERP